MTMTRTPWPIIDPQPDTLPTPNQTDKTLAQIRTELLTTFSAANSLGAVGVAREARARHRVVPSRLFGDRRFVVANAMTVVLQAPLTGSLLLLPFVLIFTYGYSAAAAGAVFLPFSAIMTIDSRTAGCLALTTVVLDAAPSDLGGSSRSEQPGRAAWRPRRCLRARIRVRSTSASALASVCGCRRVPARDVDGGGARRGRRVNGNCVARR